LELAHYRTKTFETVIKFFYYLKDSYSKPLILEVIINENEINKSLQDINPNILIVLRLYSTIPNLGMYLIMKN